MDIFLASHQGYNVSSNISASEDCVGGLVTITVENHRFVI